MSSQAPRPPHVRSLRLAGEAGIAVVAVDHIAAELGSGGSRAGELEPRRARLETVQETRVN